MNKQWKGHDVHRQKTIAIDSCCSFSIAKRKKDFIGPMKSCNMTIQGLSGKSRVTKMGTWRFTLEDEEGIMHDLEISNTL